MSWQRVRGHEPLVKAFDEVVQRGRLAHAYLLIGPPGVGKRLFAGELAKALLCEASPSHLQACDRCPGCVQVEAGTHPDFFAVSRPEESLKMPIEVVRELCRNFALKPARGHGKVAILDDADDLHDEITNHAAANCFLKTLEEPPPRSVFLLIGTTLDRQLPTIISRCQIVRFSPLSEKLVAEVLREQGVTDAAQVKRLTQLSDGSPGQALALADSALWAFRGKLLAALFQPRPDSVTLAREWIQFVEDAGKESALKRRRAALVLRLLVTFLRDALCTTVGASPRMVEPEDQRLLHALVERSNPEKLGKMLERCLDAEEQIERRVQLELVLEALVDALCRIVESKLS